MEKYHNSAWIVPEVPHWLTRVSQELGALRLGKAVFGLLLVVLGTAPCLAQQLALSQSDVTYKVSAPVQRLEMIINTSRILTLDNNVPKLLVANPELLTATPLAPNQIQISALKTGVTQLNLWDESGQVFTIDVIVMGDARELADILRAEFPDTSLRVRPLPNSVMISGYVPRSEMVSQIVAIAEDYYPKVHNNMSVGGVRQVRLNIKIIEVSRSKLRSLGVDWSKMTGNDFVTSGVSGLINAATTTSATGDTMRFGIVGDNSANTFYAYLEALQRNNLAKVLAEPTLVTESGRAASFNAGGEFPIIIPQSLGTVSVEYKEFGTRVDAVPIVLGDGRIHLQVRPQVSEVDAARSVTINNTTVPSLLTRWVDTAVEMKAGQTLALAGLVQERVEAQNRGVPVLADMPWVGSAFRSVKEEVNEIELLILVTPELVDAMDAEQVPSNFPGQSTTSPTNYELYINGELEVPLYGQCLDGTCNECSRCQTQGHGQHVLPGFSLLGEQTSGIVTGSQVQWREGSLVRQNSGQHQQGQVLLENQHHSSSHGGPKLVSPKQQQESRIVPTKIPVTYRNQNQRQMVINSNDQRQTLPLRGAQNRGQAANSSGKQIGLIGPTGYGIIR